jgi:hypothetical protein
MKKNPSTSTITIKILSSSYEKMELEHPPAGGYEECLRRRKIICELLSTGDYQWMEISADDSKRK